jgi:ankyrin repeat protein
MDRSVGESQPPRRFVSGRQNGAGGVGQAARRRVVEQTNEEGMTPLMIAARSGCFETFELLLQARTLPPPAPRLVASSPRHHARTRASTRPGTRRGRRGHGGRRLVRLGSPFLSSPSSVHLPWLTWVGAQHGAQDTCRDVAGRRAYHHA